MESDMTPALQLLDPFPRCTNNPSSMVTTPDPTEIGISRRDIMPATEINLDTTNFNTATAFRLAQFNL
jgi:hypothetical protein